MATRSGIAARLIAAVCFAAIALATGACKRSTDKDKAPTVAADDAAVESGLDPAPQSLHTDFVKVAGATYEGWISPRTSGDPYIPTPEAIDALESKTADSFAKAQAAGEIPPEVDLSTYVRQYRGYRHEGQRFIEVDFICAESASLARKHVKVAAGYTCFVHALYRVDEGTLGRWRVNPKRS